MRLRPAMRPPPLVALAPLALLLAIVAAGCGSDDGRSPEAEITAVATTMQAGDLVRAVGGERVDVETILEAGADPHDYEPRPSDVKTLADAALVVKSGGDIDAWLDEVIENAGGEAQVVTLIDGVETRTGGHEHAEEEGDAEEDDEHAEDELDPHWWQDPLNAVLAVHAVQRELAAADPDGQDVYRRNAERYKRRLHRLHADIERCMDRLAPAERKVVTTHDSLGYFAARYGIEIVGSVIPSLSTHAQASAKDVDRLVEQIRDEGVKAIFPESAVNPKLEQAISREAGAEVGRRLWTDSLASDGPESTYIGAMRANADALAEGMSGGAMRCR
jgi:zinc/manganese transport system substrate-binding protein